MKKPNILWNVFHPQLGSSRGNRLLLDSMRSISGLTIVDQYLEYPSFNIDVKREQERLKDHDLIVFQHPMYWYSVPALFKEWQDKVLSFGFAYPPKIGKALHGKHWLSVITTGGPEWSYRSGGYNNFTLSELLRPLQQTAYLCGMMWNAPFAVHSVLPADYEEIRSTTDAEVRRKAEDLKSFIMAYDLERSRSIEPVIAPHAYRSVDANAEF